MMPDFGQAIRRKVFRCIYYAFVLNCSSVCLGDNIVIARRQRAQTSIVPVGPLHSLHLSCINYLHYIFLLLW